MVSGKALLHLKDKTLDERDQLVWRWLKGAATSRGDFGDPTTDTSYRLCIYDGDANLIATAAAPAGQICGTKRPTPCWRATKNGYKYVDPERASDGLQKLDLREGTDGQARILVTGKGDDLLMPTLPITSLPVTVQLKNREGACWGATYRDVKTNRPEEFRAKTE